jgi:tRNA (cytidine/uridine-2'-O-)-methyltransferase
MSDAAPYLLALYEPDIAQNAGAIMRTCACFGVEAAIIEPAGFRIADSRFRRRNGLSERRSDR